jgi:hypothetical protein
VHHNAVQGTFSACGLFFRSFRIQFLNKTPANCRFAEKQHEAKNLGVEQQKRLRQGELLRQSPSLNRNPSAVLVLLCSNRAILRTKNALEGGQNHQIGLSAAGSRSTVLKTLRRRKERNTKIGNWREGYTRRCITLAITMASGFGLGASGVGSAYCASARTMGVSHCGRQEERQK